MKKTWALILLAGILLSVASCRAVPEPERETAAETTASILSPVPTLETTADDAVVVATDPANKASSAYAYDYPGIAPVVAAVPTDPFLIYVSRDYALPANYEPALQVCVSIYPEKIEMEVAAAKQYKAMYDAALADGAELVPFSGYRSISRQKSNFDREIESYVSKGYSRVEAVNLTAQSILPPGCSEHNSGLAMDITRPGVWDTREDFDTTKEFTWLQAHAHEYGFILRYPKDKQDTLNVIYEPWHWRYVGIGPATAMKTSGQCLEEYLGITN